MDKAKNAQSEDQLSFLPMQTPQKEQKPTRCDGCANYAGLKEPYHYEKEGYPQGVTVYGFCAKNVRSMFSFYPVYLPDGGVCTAFKKRRLLAESNRSDGSKRLLCDGRSDLDVLDGSAPEV